MVLVLGIITYWNPIYIMSFFGITHMDNRLQHWISQTYKINKKQISITNHSNNRRIMAITLENLTQEQKDALYSEMEAKKQALAQKLADDRKAYKELVNANIPKLFESLKAASAALTEAKKMVYSGVKALVEMKQDAYGRTGDQYSHSFTTDSGVTIMIGDRISDGWDDTVTAGLQKVDEFLGSLAKDRNSKLLLEGVRRLLAKDAKGNLKSSRVLQLKTMAETSGDPNFIDGVNIIQNAYRPVRSRSFVTCRYKDEEGNTINLPLDITECELEKEE
ncbi:hypothetical protein D3C72_1514600 [compost metagenome]